MRAVGALIALGLVGCLEPGRPYLAKLDEVAPTVVRTVPTAGGTLSQSARIVITFSEEMEPRSLVPGIGVFLGRDEQRVQVYRVTAPATRYVNTQQPYETQVGPPEGTDTFTPGTTYSLVLRTLLLDAEGNPLAAEQVIPFSVVP